MHTILCTSDCGKLGQEIDGRSDLFAFGIILYEMIAGRHPWPCRFAVDTMHAILHDDPLPLQTPWAGVLEKLLRKNRDERYTMADAVLEVLSNPSITPGFAGRYRSTDTPDSPAKPESLSTLCASTAGRKL